MYNSLLSSVLWYLSLPVLIYFSYRVCLLVIKRFEKKLENEVNNQEN